MQQHLQLIAVVWSRKRMLNSEKKEQQNIQINYDFSFPPLAVNDTLSIYINILYNHQKSHTSPSTITIRCMRVSNLSKLIEKSDLTGLNTMENFTVSG